MDMSRIVTVTPTTRDEAPRQPGDEAPRQEELVGGFAIPIPRNDISQEELASLFLKEFAYPAPRDYLKTVLNACGEQVSVSQGVTENWRRRLCEWMFEVVDHFSFDREVVAFALGYLDRSVALAYGPSDGGMTLSKRDYQLYAVTSLYLAIKVHGEMDGTTAERLKLRVSTFKDLSRGFFSVETIEAKEREMLSLLQWRVNPPTCAQFISYFLGLLPEWDPNDQECSREEVVVEIFDLAKYLTELSLFRSHFTINHTPSTVAYGAILCAMESMQGYKTVPLGIQLQFLINLREVRDSLKPDGGAIRDIQVNLKKLAPRMFTPNAPPLPRTVSLVELGTGSPVPATSRADSSICVSRAVGTVQPSRKRQKKTVQPSRKRQKVHNN
jgi:Cyclin, N-terminal domain/Cyclin, C-terminal domain